MAQQRYEVRRDGDDDDAPRSPPIADEPAPFYSSSHYPIRWTLVIMSFMVTIIALVMIVTHTSRGLPVPNEFWIVLGTAIGYIGGTMMKIGER